jgi:hypothetical protein
VIGYILIGQNHLYVKMLVNRVSAIRKCFRRFCTVCKSEISVPCQPSGRRVIPFGRPAVQSFIHPDKVVFRPDAHQLRNIRPNDMSYRLDAHQTKASSIRMTWIPVLTFLFVEKLRAAPACIRPDISAARPNDPQCSIKPYIFFPKANMGRLLQLSGRRGFPSGRATP